MSADENGDDGPGRREVARRLFATEFEDADLQYSESDEERAPNYVVTPSGARVNRLFFAGVLTELEQVNESMLRARIVDPTGAFVAYAGQYQPDELAFLERVEPPAFLAVTGKARTFQPEDSDRVFTSVRPETINEVDAATRDRWVVDAARRTVERVEVVSRAIESGLAGDELRESLVDEGVDPSLASGVALALDHYGTTPAYLAALRETALDAVRVVADEIEEVEGISIAPDEGGDASVPGRSAATVPDTGGPARSSSSTAMEPGDGTGAGDGTDATPSTDDLSGTSTVTDTDDEPTGAASTDDVGEFDVGEFDADADAGVTGGDDTDADLVEPDESFEPDEDVLDPEEDVLDPEEREEIESEYGTDFSTADDVEAAPDAAPDTEPEPEPAGPEGTTEPVEPAAEEPAVEEPAAGDEEEAPASDDGADEPVDVETAVLETIEALDDGEGADREAVAARVADEYGVSESAADDAIEEAMMSGQCYEPADGRVKSI